LFIRSGVQIADLARKLWRNDSICGEESIGEGSFSVIYVSENADISDGVALLLEFCQLGWLYHGHLDEPGGEEVEDSSVLSDDVYVCAVEGYYLEIKML
jgi:hypothetical protein